MPTNLARYPLVLILSAPLLLVATATADAQGTAPRSGRQVYESTCITCHGPDGRAGVNAALEQVAKPPDFTSCAFASREPDRGFLAVAHGGGPARGFSALMPPWGAAFTEDELSGAIAYLRTFCKDDRWPRGELNLPLALATGKAFPEDEAVVRVTARSGQMTTKAVYERRFGALNQWEIAVPFSSLDEGAGRRSGIGDIALGYKRTLAHSLSRGNIMSVSAELALPTGRERDGLGSGVATFEPFVTFGQIVHRHGFVQAQAGFGLPLKAGHEKEAFWRVAVGRSFEQKPFGRLWSPMVEVLAVRPLVRGTSIEWDLLPGAQVTLNRRQHVRLGAGIRLPVTDAAARSKSLVTYLLWDWYEGGFLQGW